MEISGVDIKLLADMLKTEESSDSEDDLPNVGLAKMGPGHIGMGRTRKEPKKDEDGKGDADNNITNEKSIWDEDEIPEGIRYDESDDPRKRPEFQIKYKQAVTAEDMFLQMGAKTTATSSCEDMVVIIQLKGENYSEVDLDVKKQVLELRSPKYRLSLPLPHPVDTNSNKAVWDSDTEVLTVTLRMKREFDLVNF